MAIFFSSDTHYSHANIIKYCNRPFSSVDEMNDSMIERWNSKVKSDDDAYIIGDFSFGDINKSIEILKQLNGKITLIYGNHDKSVKKHQELHNKFYQCVDYLELNINGQFIIMSHYAMLVWNKARYGSWMLHGHSHGTLKYPFECKILDVGVDSHDFYPLSFDDVKILMDKKIYNQIDYHK